MNKSLRLFASILLLCAAAGFVSAQTITDILDDKTIGISGREYKSWTKALSSGSGATYRGNSTSEKRAIKLRSANYSGIVVSSTAGTVKSITLTFPSNIEGRKVEIYGKNTPYSSTSELYGEVSSWGDRIGSIATSTEPKDTTITPDKAYAYIGIRTKGGLVYVEQIKIEWAKGDFAVSTPKIQGLSPFNSTTTISITSDEGAEIYYTLNGDIPSPASAKYTKPFMLNETTTIKAVAVKNGTTSAVSTAKFEKSSGESHEPNNDIAEKGSLQTPYSVTEVIKGQYNHNKLQGVYVEGYICGAYDNNYKINNTVSSNILIGATADANDTIAIQLPQGSLRDAINVTGGMMGTRVILKGNIATYFGRSGLKSTSEAYVGIHLSNARYATMYFSKATLQLPKNLTANTYKMDNGKLTVSKKIVAGENLAAGTAVVLNGEPGDYWCKVITNKKEGRVTDPGNILRGTDDSHILPDHTDSCFYMLSLNKAGDLESVGFYWGKDGGAAFTNGAHKAYLQLPKGKPGANAKSCFLFSNTSTSIQPAVSLISPHANTQSYNIAGQRVNRSYKGIIIRNGKKYINK